MSNVQQPPISLFMTAKTRKYHRRIHCMECGLPIAEITGMVTTSVDNNGIPLNELPIESRGWIEVQCSRSTCHQHYRIFI